MWSDRASWTGFSLIYLAFRISSLVLLGPGVFTILSAASNATGPVGPPPSCTPVSTSGSNYSGLEWKSLGPRQNQELHIGTHGDKNPQETRHFGHGSCEGANLRRAQFTQEHRPTSCGCSGTLTCQASLPIEPRPRVGSASQGQPGLARDRRRLTGNQDFTGCSHHHHSPMTF